MRILKETGDYIAVYKSAGEAVESKRPGQRALVNEILSLQARRNQVPGGPAGRKNGRNTDPVPYAAVINRLDQPVEGIVLFALNKRAAAVLSRQMTEGKMQKEYLAAVSPVPEKDEAELVDFLLKDGRTNVSRIVPEGTAGAKKAVLRYRILERSAEGCALLRVELFTGRHHQIRVQLAGAGFPILGDNKYGKRELRDSGVPLGEKIFPALCAEKLIFSDPSGGERTEIRVRPEGRAFREAGFFPETLSCGND